MNDKSVSSVYSVLSIFVWIIFISLIVFVLVLFGIGENQSPSFCVQSIEISEVSAVNGGSETTEKQFCAEISGKITGASFSPYYYTAENVVLLNDFAQANHCSITLDAPLTYSKTQADDFVLTVNMVAKNREEALNLLKNTDFALRNVKQHYAFLEKDIQMFLPYFSLSDYADLIV